jgi:uridine kinase
MAIGGGSGSGKSTLARALSDRLAPRRVLILAEDDYYRDNAATPGFDAATFNFDDIAAHDHALLAQDLAALRAGLSIQRPAYCYVTHRRLDAQSPTDPADVIIVEGIHILYPPELRPLFDLTVYVDVPDDVRFARRLLRDVKERGRDAGSVVAQYLRTVRPMHYRYTHPSRFDADMIVADDELWVREIETVIRRRLVPMAADPAAASRHLPAPADDSTRA